MSMDVEYAIKKDIRNNPIVREVDREQKRAFGRTVLAFSLIVGMLLFSAWQHFEIRRHGYETERLRTERAQEEAINRKLRLELEALRAPQRIEQIATDQLHMTSPTANDTLIIQRVGPRTPDKAIVAAAR
jgi:cell division protein FtsL